MEPAEVYRFMVELKADIREDFAEIKTHLKTQNGRIAGAETKIAVLEDRSGAHRGVSAKWGAAMGAAIVGAFEAFRWMSGK